MVKKHQFDAVQDVNVFRYLSYEKFKSLVDTSALYFSRMDLMDDREEGMLYQNGGESNRVYGSCWRLYDLGNHKELFKKYKCEDGVIIKTSISSLRKFFKIFAHSRHSTVADGLCFPFVIFGKVEYIDKKRDKIELDAGNIETMFSQLCWNMDHHFLPYLSKMKEYQFEQEMRIFTKWQTITYYGPSYLSENAIFKTHTGDKINLRCTSVKDISSIENIIRDGATFKLYDLEHIEQMQPIGFFYPIELNEIIEEIYTQNSTEDNIRMLLSNSNYSYLSERLKVL